MTRRSLMLALAAVASAVPVCAVAAPPGGPAVPSISTPRPAPLPAPAATAPPNGDPQLTAKVDGAIAGATSYRVVVHAPNVALTIRNFGPDRLQIHAVAGSAESDSIVVGGAMYYKPANAPWQTFAVPPIVRVRHNRLYMAEPDALLQPLPDRIENGVALGAFRSLATGNGGVPGVMDCTYDRGTFRPRSCTVTLAGLTAPIDVVYAGWDDPANVVEPPPGVPPPTPPPSPAHPASPSPAPRATP